MTRTLPNVWIVLLGSLCLPSVLGAQTLLERLARQLENAPAQDTLPPPRGSSSSAVPAGPPTLGVRLGPLTSESVQAYRLTVRQGALVTAVEQGSPADAAGLRPGCAVVAMDGRRIDSPEDAVAALRGARSGQPVEITWYDQDRLVRKRVTLAASSVPALLPPPDAVRTPPPPPVAATPAKPPRPAAADGVPAVVPREGAAGGSGSRPLLGRLGRILENVVTPALATEPVVPLEANRPLPEDDVAALRTQLQLLQQQVATLQRQVESLERRLNERRPDVSLPPPPPR